MTRFASSFCVSQTARRWTALALLPLLALTSIAPAATYRLRILSATWGLGNKRVDVYPQVQSRVKEGGVHITATGTIFGDPVPGAKELIVVYELNGVRHTEHVMQNDHLSIGGPPVIAGDARIKPEEVDKLHNWAQNSPDVKPTDIGVEIMKDGCIRSDTALTVPVRIDATVATDSTNIRLYFGDRGLVIFNWELNQEELRYHVPPNGDTLAVGNKGYVPVDTWMHISWIIEPHRATVLVDGQTRLVTDGNYTGLAGTAGVGTHNATLQLTQFDFATVAPGVGAEPQPRPFNRVARMPPPDPLEIPGLLSPIKRPQSEIKALYVQEEQNGEMLGLASELILTATPGEPRGYTPVMFVSPVGTQMTAVLDDALRSVRVKYPKWAASRVELSFEDRTTPKDGGSIGAAIGTLLLSMLNGFEIDSHVAMTGDLTADGKLRRIGGVAAKIRGATSANCKIVVLPAENYEQVADAMVFEGPELITGIQLIGAETVQEASAIACVERKEKLSQAIDEFASVAAILKKTPERIHTKDIQTRLADVVELAPNHISAKLLLLQSQNKEPKKLSPTASLYYTFLPVRTMLPSLFEPAQPGRSRNVTPLVIQQGLISLRKLRTRVDPKIYPMLDAMIEYVQMVDAVNNGKRTPEDLEPRRKRLVD